jgi:hypothetical protein
MSKKANELKDETIETPTKTNLIPLDDPLYVNYRNIIEDACPAVTFFDHFPSRCPTTFKGGEYTFICSVPVIVPAQRINGLIKGDIFNRMLMASIIRPMSYSEIKSYEEKNEQRNSATPEDLQHWKNEVESKNPEYFELKRFCQDKNIQTLETLYIDDILDKIKKLMVYRESR